MKLSQYAKRQGISYSKVLRWFVYSIYARLYGQLRAKRITERLVEQLQAKEDDHATR